MEFKLTPDEWLQEVLAVHFDPVWGTRYWLERQKVLGIDARRDIKTIDDLAIFGPMEEDALRYRPIEDFVPRKLLEHREKLILGDTAGTTGPPKVAIYSEEDFYEAFVEYFGYVAEARDFPTGENWLWIGPSGPHIIGKAARQVAKRMGSCDPFAIDFDPRWIKKLLPGTIAWERYQQHIIDQALSILQHQDIGVLFTTPPLLHRLATLMVPEARECIKGVHYGGMSLDKSLYQSFREMDFPRAIHISGYGNTLFGVCLELEDSPTYDLDYYPPGPRLILRVISLDSGKSPEQRLREEVPYGKAGQVVFHRLDKSGLIINMFERDSAIRLPPSDKAKSMGIFGDGIRNPQPITNPHTKVSLGLY
jgi:hypothetical protein